LFWLFVKFACSFFYTSLSILIISHVILWGLSLLSVVSGNCMGCVCVCVCVTCNARVALGGRAEDGATQFGFVSVPPGGFRSHSQGSRFFG
jgi:hypothetical protein